MRLTSVVLIFSLALFSRLATADTSDGYDITRNRHYGNCRVWTQVDMLTDEESHHLKCKQETITDVTEVGINQWDPATGNLELRVGKGLMLHLDDRMPVAIRIDKGKVVRGQWEWFSENMVAILRNHDLATSLMDELAAGHRVVIQVGEERGNVILDGSAAAVKDFRSRIRQPETANSPLALPSSAETRFGEHPSGNSGEASELARVAIEDLPAQTGSQGTSTNQSSDGVPAELKNILVRAYEQRVRARIINVWRLPIPEKTAQGLHAVALLTIDREGYVIRYELTRSSGNPSFDASLLRAVLGSSPLPKLPRVFQGESQELRLRFTPPAP